LNQLCRLREVIEKVGNSITGLTSRQKLNYLHVALA